ncbi:Glutamate decarboxylase 2 [Coemansia sp. RSA 2610]|nr:Glutamate decarboxylase 2 [Coemansia sp. RSA 2610]
MHDSMDAADELQALLSEAARVFGDYARQSQQGSRPIAGQSDAAQLRARLNLDEFPESGIGTRIWDDVQAVCQTAATTWSERFLYKLYAAPAPAGVLGELLVAVLNNNAHVFRAAPGGTLIEQAVARELARRAGCFDGRAAGLTFPGGSYANMHAMVVARNHVCPETRRAGSQGGRLAVFTSAHAHYSIDKAAMAMGVGLDNVVHVPVDAHGRMDAAQLRRLMQGAVARGSTPFFVNATVGTTVLGACDPVAELARVSAEFGAWLHVDASWGGPLALFADVFALPARGVDSLTVNPHKLLGVPLQCSFLLVREGLGAMRRALGLGAQYLFHGDVDECGGTESLIGEDAGDATLGCGRRPDAIKFWLMWRYYGTRYFEARVAHARRMALALAARVRERQQQTRRAGRWRLVAEPAGTCVCFWFAPRAVAGPEPDAQWGAATRRVCARINASGAMLLDYAAADARPDFFRIPLNSPAVSEQTLDQMLDLIERTGAELYELE